MISHPLDQPHHLSFSFLFLPFVVHHAEASGSSSLLKPPSLTFLLTSEAPRSLPSLREWHFLPFSLFPLPLFPLDYEGRGKTGAKQQQTQKRKTAKPGFFFFVREFRGMRRRKHDKRRTKEAFFLIIIKQATTNKQATNKQ